MTEHLISRRLTLKYFSLAMGTEAGRKWLAGWLPGGGPVLQVPTSSQNPKGDGSLVCESPVAGVADQLRFFKPEEFETVEILTEMIIPTDEKPGAREARVASYIDFITFASAEFQPGLQREWIEGLSLLDALSHSKYGQAFREISPPQRQQLLEEMSLPEHDSKAAHPGFGFYRLVKEMTVEGFYSSQVGLMEALEYKGLTFQNSFAGCTHVEHR
jgi:hypothetical protein